MATGDKGSSGNDTANYMAVIEKLIRAMPGCTCNVGAGDGGRVRATFVSYDGKPLWFVEEATYRLATASAARKAAEELAKLGYAKTDGDPHQLVLNAVEAAGWHMEFRMGATAAWVDTLEIRSRDGGAFRRVHGAGLKDCLRRMAELLKTHPPTPAQEASSDEG